MKDIIGKIPGNKDFIQEFFNIFSYILGGLIFLLSVNYFYINLDLNKLVNLIPTINNYGEHIPIFILSVLFLYIIGYFSILIFELLVYILGNVFKALSKLKIIGPIFKYLTDFFYIKYSLHSEQEKLSVDYKAGVGRIISTYFNIRMDVADADRLCKQICLQNNLIKLYEINHAFILYKTLLISLIIILIKLVGQHFYLSFCIDLLLIIFVFKKLRDSTLKIRINYIDAAIVYIKSISK